MNQMDAFLHSLNFQVLRMPAVAALLCCALTAVAADVEPYEARIATPRAQVRSGPGEKYYPTDTLTSGETVEVYREEADGWLGIRPPEKSFSLVMERQLKLRDDGLAEIDEPNVACRIGSRFSDHRNAVQVQLKKGEVVEVLDTFEEDGKTWCKIAPPAGEFRWVHATSVQPVGALTQPAEEPADEEAIVTASATTETPPEPPREGPKTAPLEPPPLVTEPVAPTPGDQWRSPGSGSPTPASPAAQPALQPITPIAAASPPAAAAPASTAPATTAEVTLPPPAVAAAPPASADLQRQLTEIEMRLSRMASASPHLWNTERLERDTEQLLSQAQSDADRNAIKVTMAKIDHFDALGKRYQGGAGSGDPRATNAVAGLSEAGPLAATPSSSAPSNAPVGVVPGEAGRYDAVGILRPVVSKRPGAPQFALVDERGQVVTFVTPTPDVNLQPYLGRRVGIAGNRGFIPEFNRAHVTAGRVTPLAQGMVR
jgi:uncharacterized protein YgiM (DUF1202 family)